LFPVPFFPYAPNTTTLFALTTVATTSQICNNFAAKIWNSLNKKQKNKNTKAS